FFLPLATHLPPPTLFPYTTLFRSNLRRDGRRNVAVLEPLRRTRHVGDECVRRVREDARRRRPVHDPGARQQRPEDRNVRREPRRDRKSTRLNSSHSQISYAVFCLK